MDLTEKMVEKLDEIYDTADALLTLLFPDYEHDMSVCGEVVDLAEKELLSRGIPCCYPYVTDDSLCDSDFTADGSLCCGHKTCLLQQTTQN